MAQSCTWQCRCPCLQCVDMLLYLLPTLLLVLCLTCWKVTCCQCNTKLHSCMMSHMRLGCLLSITHLGVVHANTGPSCWARAQCMQGHADGVDLSCAFDPTWQPVTRYPEYSCEHNARRLDTVILCFRRHQHANMTSLWTCISKHDTCWLRMCFHHHHCSC